MLKLIFNVRKSLNLSYKKDGICYILKKRFVDIIIDVRDITSIGIFESEAQRASKREPDIHSYNPSYLIGNDFYKKHSRIIDSKYKVYNYEFSIEGHAINVYIRLKNDKIKEFEFEEIISSIKPSKCEVEGAILVD